MQRSRPRFPTSYSARRTGRQSLPYFRAAVLGAIAVVGAGCSVTGIDQATTGGIVASAIADGVDPSDWEAVRRTIAEIGAEALDRVWANPRTGSSGTVTAMAMEPRGEGICRAFATTVSDVRGVRSYRGEACRAGSAEWRITGITPDDRALL